MTKKAFKHAFAIHSVTGTNPTEKQKDVVDKVCREISRRHLSIPALIFLESFRPLNYIGSQVMHFFHPFISAITNANGFRIFSEFLESRSSIDYLYNRIEYFENEFEKEGINKNIKSDE
jgi:hypothetical protein